jgi:hypothetical protein
VGEPCVQQLDGDVSTIPAAEEDRALAALAEQAYDLVRPEVCRVTRTQRRHRQLLSVFLRVITLMRLSPGKT